MKSHTTLPKEPKTLTKECGELLIEILKKGCISISLCEVYKE